MRLSSEYRRQSRSGAVLVAVLIVLPLMFLAAYQFSQLMLQENAAAQSALKTAQAKAFANSGINMCAVYLSSSTAMSGNLNSNPYSNTGSFQSVSVSDGNGNVIGRFAIVAPYDQNDPNFSANSQSSFRYGVIDESSKININTLAKSSLSDAQFEQVLENLDPNGLVTQQIADSIRTWFDGKTRANAADNTYYNGLSPPYNLKSAPFDSVDELLLIEGMTPQILYGTDWNRNGMQDSGEASGGPWDPGIAPYLTVYSRELNTDSTNNPRINLKGSSLQTIHDGLVSAIDQTTADFITLYLVHPTPAAPPGAAEASAQEISDEVAKALKQTNYTSPPAFSSIYQLAGNVTPSWTVMTPGQRPKIVKVTNNPIKSQLSQKLPVLADKTTTSSAQEFPGKINLLTAPQSVLNAFAGQTGAGILGLTQTTVQTILQTRPDVTQGLPTDQKYQSLAWLVIDAKLDATIVGALDSYFTSRTTVYRAQAIGYFDGDGPVARIEAVIDATNGYPRIVMWRDLSELGKGYNITSTNQ